MDDIHAKIIDVLTGEPKALMIKEIARKCNLNPHTIARKLDALEILGNVRKIQIGNAKKYFLIDPLPVSSLCDISSDFILIIDQDWIVQYVNKSAQEVFNPAVHSIIGKRLDLLNLELFSMPEVLHGVKGFASQKVHRIEVSLMRQGVCHWYGISIMKFSIQVDSLLIAIIAEDITEKKQMHEKILESETRYRNLFEYAPIPINEEDYSLVKQKIDTLLAGAVSDLSRYFDDHPEFLMECIGSVRIVKMNQKSRELVHLDSSDVCDVSLDILPYLTDESMQEIKRLFVSLTEGWVFTDYYIKSHNEEGIIHYYRVHLSLMDSNPMDYSKVYAAYINITEERELLRKQQEIISLAESVFLKDSGVIRAGSMMMSDQEKLRDQNEMLFPAINMFGALVLLWDNTFRIVWMSSAFCRFTGRSYADCVGLPVEMLLPDHDFNDEVKILTQIAATTRLYGEICFVHADGQVKRAICRGAGTGSAPDTRMSGIIILEKPD